MASKIPKKCSFSGEPNPDLTLGEHVCIAAGPRQKTKLDNLKVIGETDEWHLDSVSVSPLLFFRIHTTFVV